MKVFVDTSALIALLDAEDRWHAEASATFDGLRRSTELVTTNYVLVECLAVARRRLGREAATSLLDALFPVLNVIWVTPPMHAPAVAAYRSGRGPASVVDEVSLGVMRSAGILEAFAYDDDFQREGFRRAAPSATQDRVHEKAATYGVDLASELVSVTEIAARAGRPINTIQSWRRRHTDFPPPVAQLAAGPIWNWPRVAEWIAARTRSARVPIA